MYVISAGKRSEAVGPGALLKCFRQKKIVISPKFSTLTPPLAQVSGGITLHAMPLSEVQTFNVHDSATSYVADEGWNEKESGFSEPPHDQGKNPVIESARFVYKVRTLPL